MMNMKLRIAGVHPEVEQKNLFQDLRRFLEPTAFSVEWLPRSNDPKIERRVVVENVPPMEFATMQKKIHNALYLNGRHNHEIVRLEDLLALVDAQPSGQMSRVVA